MFLSARFLFAQTGEMQFVQTDVEARNKYRIENITVSDGLHHNNIYDVLQDSLGFLWLASGNGLQKYDGYTFSLYHPNPADSTFEAVYGLYEDQQQNLWIQSATGLSSYQRETDDFVAYHFVNSDGDTIPYQVMSVAEDLNGTVWAWIDYEGLFKIDWDTNSFQPQKKINEWFRETAKQVILKETSRKGIYETSITFSSGHHGRRLRYKYAVRRKNGSLEWEPNPNPAVKNGNREIILAGDSLNLPIVAFNSGLKIDQEILPGPRSTYVRFSVNMTLLDTPLSKGDEVQIRGDVPPLRWRDEFWVNFILFDSENQLWIGTDNIGLFRLNPETGEYINFVRNTRIPGAISSNTITAGILDRDGDLWFGSDYGLNKYDPDTQAFEKYFVDPLNILTAINGAHRIEEDEQGNIWTQSHLDAGISNFNKKTEEFTHYSPGFGQWFSSITADRSGIVWLGNEFRGLFKLNPGAKKFSTFSIRKDGQDVLQGNSIYALYEDRVGDIWIGGHLDGLYRYNPQTGEARLYTVDAANEWSNTINYIFQDRKGAFWIGKAVGLNRFDPETGRFESIKPIPDISSAFDLTSYIYEDVDGLLWVLTRRGCLVHLNPDTHEAEFFTVFGNSDRDGQIEFCDLIEDPRGFFWIAAGNNMGLYKFDLFKKEFSIVEKIGKVNISSICLGENGILWCGTVGQGLIRYDSNADTKVVLTEKDGLLSSSIMGLEADDSGNLWLGSSKGLSRYNPQTGIFKHYFKEDGFLTDEFSYQASTKGKDGELIFGSMHGVVAFYPDSIKDSGYIPPVVVTDFRINNTGVSIGKDSPLKKHISVSDEITLTHDQNDISITFAALDYSHPERNQYTFFLENFEEDWRPPGLERTAYYTNLDPGDYVFRVKGTNGDDVWNDEGASVKITILPPWWQTGWAYTLYAVLFLLTLYGLRRFELKRVQLRNELEKWSFESRKLKEVDELKSRFFANISHEFRTPLTLILGPLERLLGEDFPDSAKKQFSLMKRNAQRLRQLINQLLDLSKVEAGKMKLAAKPGDIVSIVRTMVLSFSSLADRKGIELVFDSSQERIATYFDQEKLENIISNLLSNALKFTPEGGKISVQLALSDNKSSGIKSITDHCLLIIVEDTGPGIPETQREKIFDRFYQLDGSRTREQEGTGIGLALTKEFVELHHGEIRVDSEVGNGAIFTVTLPLGRDHLSYEEIAEPDRIEETRESAKPEEIFAEDSDYPEDGKDGSRQAVVLIVEDNHDMRYYVCECLADGYDLLQAENGESGLEMAIAKMPDLVISDIMMPVMDGLEFCEKLKADIRTSHIPVILLTARASGESKVEGLETGADDYLIKPFDVKELQVRVRNLIAQRQQLRERFQKEVILGSGQIEISSADEKFLEKVTQIVQTYMVDPDFSIAIFAREAGLSRMQLHRKLQALTGLSASRFIRTLRLKQAAELLKQQTGNISEIAFQVGFNSLSHFNRSFREQFNKSPSEYNSNPQ